MRLLISILITLAVIVGFGWWINSNLEASTINLTKQIEVVNNEIKQDKWENALAEIGKLEKEWGKQAKWWPILLDHQEIDNIEFSLAKIKEYIINKSKPLALGQLSELKLMLNHIPEKEKVNLKNIL